MSYKGWYIALGLMVLSLICQISGLGCRFYSHYLCVKQKANYYKTKSDSLELENKVKTLTLKHIYSTVNAKDSIEYLEYENFIKNEILK